MTATPLAAHTPAPVFPACPHWCPTTHGAYDEMYIPINTPIVAPRTHTAELHRATVIDGAYTDNLGTVRVELTRVDWDNGDQPAESDPTRLGLVAVDTYGTEINLAPTADQARALAAALLHAADLADAEAT